MTSTCEALAPLLVSRPLGLLEPDQRDRLAAHLPGCAVCQDFARAVDRALEGAALPLSSGAGPAGEDPPGWAALAARIEAQRRVGELVTLECVYCHDRLLRGESVFCAACLAPHHADCFQGHGACSVPGCTETQVVRPATLGRPAATSPGGRVRWTVLVAVVGSALSVAALWPGEPDAVTPLVPAPPAVVEAGSPPSGVELEPAGSPPAVIASGGVFRLAPPASWLEGRVLAVRAELAPPLALISLGADDGVELRQRFWIHRGDQVVGQVQVEKVLRDSAGCRILSTAEGQAIEEGDGARLVVPDRYRIDCQNQEVQLLIRQLAEQAGLDIVLPPELQGRVSMNVEEVHPLRALHAIVRTVGEYELVEESDRLLRVVPRGAIAQQVTTRIVPLTRARPPAEDLRRLLELALRQRADEEGLSSARLEYDLATNCFLITGPNPALKVMERLIRDLEAQAARADREPAQDPAPPPAPPPAQPPAPDPAPPAAPAPDPALPEIWCVVVSVQGQVLISVGADDGVERGQRFEITRGQQVVGEVEVVEVKRDSALCRVLQAQQPLQPGDQGHLTAGPR